MAYGGINKWTPPRKLGGIPRVSTSVENEQAARDGTAEPVSRDQIIKRERGTGNIDFSCLADHEPD